MHTTVGPNVDIDHYGCFLVFKKTYSSKVVFLTMYQQKRTYHFTIKSKHGTISGYFTVHIFGEFVVLVLS